MKISFLMLKLLDMIINPITPSVHKMVKRTLIFLQYDHLKAWLFYGH